MAKLFEFNPHVENEIKHNIDSLNAALELFNTKSKKLAERGVIVELTTNQTVPDQCSPEYPVLKAVCLLPIPNIKYKELEDTK